MAVTTRPMQLPDGLALTVLTIAVAWGVIVTLVGGWGTAMSDVVVQFSTAGGLLTGGIAIWVITFLNYASPS